MSSRRKIEKFCKEHGFKILYLEFNRARDACFGDTWRADYWALAIEFKEKPLNCFVTTRGDGSISEDIDEMFEDILFEFDMED